MLAKEDDKTFGLAPDPDKVRARLAVVATEYRLLRDQLKLSERAERERRRVEGLLAGTCGGSAP